MKMKSLIKAKVLIVEDREEVLDDNEKYLNDIGSKENFGISNLEIMKAGSLEKALKILYGNIDSPFHIVLLDLHLQNPNIIPPEIKNFEILKDDSEFTGFTILRFIKSFDSAEYIIVVSANPDINDNLRKAFRLGAYDFLIQPCGSKELQERFLLCWKHLILNKSQGILEQRISNLVPYAEKGLAHQFTTCFSNFVQESVHYTDDIERYMQERFGLEKQKDADDFFFKRLKDHKINLAETKSVWEELQSFVLSTDKSFKEEKVENLIIENHQKLLPCLIVKNVELDFCGENSALILSLDDDVKAVFQELILGALGSISDYNLTGDISNHDPAKEVITISVENAEGQVKVKFSDKLESIKKEDAENINKGLSISPHRRFGREWGLSVVQQIAIRGGGRLEIEPHSEKGNDITYYIPTAR